MQLLPIELPWVGFTKKIVIFSSEWKSSLFWKIKYKIIWRLRDSIGRKLLAIRRVVFEKNSFNGRRTGYTSFSVYRTCISSVLPESRELKICRQRYFFKLIYHPTARIKQDVSLRLPKLFVIIRSTKLSLNLIHYHEKNHLNGFELTDTGLQGQ